MMMMTKKQSYREQNQYKHDQSQYYNLRYFIDIHFGI